MDGRRRQIRPHGRGLFAARNKYPGRRLTDSGYFQGLLAGFSVGVVIFNKAGQVYVINEVASHILEIEEDSAKGRLWNELFSGIDEPARLTGLVQEAISSRRRAGPITARIFRKDGTTLHLSIHASTLVYYDKIWGIFVELSDVTHIFELHEREKRALEEKRLIENERVESLHQFSMAVAHQILNPTTIIGGMANLLLKRLRSPNNADSIDDEECIKRILDGGRRLETIVKAVNSYMSIQRGDLMETDLCPMIQAVRSRFEEQEVPEGSAVVWRIECADVVVRVDGRLFQKALSEVITNAVEACREKGGGMVTIVVRDAPDKVEIMVSDTGPGIPESVIPYVFDPFFTTNPKSVGMGLSTALRIVREHGGIIRIGNEAGGGAVVTIGLPRDGDLARAG